MGNFSFDAVINAINNAISGIGSAFVPTSRTITINGDSKSLAADRSWTVSAGTPAAMTKTDDTNVTLTLGGTPATSLLQAVSLTLGWTGTLADGRIASAATWNAKQSPATIDIGTYSNTGSTAEVIAKSILIPANTLAVGKLLEVFALGIRTSGTANTLQFRIRVSTSAAPSPVTSATLLATNGINSSNYWAPVDRSLFVKSATNTTGFNSATAAASDKISSTAQLTASNIDWTVDQYLHFTIQNSNAGDTGTITGIKINVL